MIHVSLGNKKIGKCWNISQLPGRDCAKELPCYKLCYAARLAAFRSSVYACWDQNGKLWRRNPSIWRNEVYASLNKYQKKGGLWARWWVAGDFIDQQQLDFVVDAAFDFPNIQFMAHTKRYDLDFTEKRPKNLMIRWSAWPGWAKKKPKGIKAITKTIPRNKPVPKEFFECLGDCTLCGRKCWFEDKVAIYQH